ncbi:MAG: hypothetical protein OQK04_19250 [Kangiellaceae bacterium]|nr:hypothetical protein [Kangiellaceae bacterium]MCW9000856.1 hypothetical protein [Kangiellaceae bacterium]
MSFQLYQDTISKEVAVCEEKKLNGFCIDVLQRILTFVDGVSQSHLNSLEKDRISTLISMVKSGSINWTEAGLILDQLTEIAEADEEHAIEMDLEFVEFLCALDNWRALLDSGERVFAASVSENMMNILDYRFVEDTSLEEWLSIEAIREEFEKQIGFLRDVT